MLYNLYRPTDFSEVKGQEDVLVTMKRQAQTGRFGHAYLLAGHRGTGKTTIARICQKPSTAKTLPKADPARYAKAALQPKTAWTSKNWTPQPITALTISRN